MKKRNLIITSALSLAIIAVASCFVINYYITFKKDNIAEEKTILIYNNYDYKDVIEAIRKSGALKNEKSFLRAARKREFRKHFESGKYLLHKGLSNQEIIRTMSNKWETPLKLVMKSHIRTLDKVASFFGENFEADSAQFAAAMADSTLLSELGFNKNTLIGMFIPNTYEIYWTAKPKNILQRFKKEYEEFWRGDRTELSETIGLDRNEVITLASIVSSETNNEGEMSRIAGVYMNRLHIKMPLQADPTVIYANRSIEPNIKRVLKRHLTIDSPYNTYINRGLPPGPINIPPIKAIDAVLHYEKSNYLYFCAKAEFDGTHNFSSTYTEHIKNQKAFVEAYRKLNADKQLTKQQPASN